MYITNFKFNFCNGVQNFFKLICEEEFNLKKSLTNKAKHNKCNHDNTIMTAETLKPFITPTTVENYVTTHSSTTASAGNRRSCYFLAITASAITVILTAALLGITIWNAIRISNLQTEVQNLNRIVGGIQHRLGFSYVDDLNALEKEETNNKALIDDVLPDNDHENMSAEDDGEDEEDDDDDDYEDYEELMNKFRHYQETEEDEEETDNSDSLGDDNLYDDFEKYNDSKRKHNNERKIRSVVALNTEMENSEEKSHNGRSNILRSKDGHPKSLVGRKSFERRRSPLKLHLSRRHKFPMVRSAKIVAPATSNKIEVKPAAHFHISHTVPYHKHKLQISNHNGDVYIGQPSLTNEREVVDNYFHVEHGVITIREPGLYYVYAQICYNNNFPKNGFTIFHGDKEFLQCLHNSHPSNFSLINTCHTSGLIYLRQNEQIHIRDFHSNRMTFLSDKSDRSYFGLIKI